MAITDPPAEANPLLLAAMMHRVTTILQPEFIPSRTLYEQYLDKMSERQYDDEAVIRDSDHVTVISQASTNLGPLKHTSLIWYWENRLWPCYTLTTWWKTSDGKSIRQVAFFPINTPAADLMFSTPIRVALISKEKCIAAFDIDLSKLDDKYWNEMPPGRVTRHIHELQGAKAYAYRLLRRRHKGYSYRAGEALVRPVEQLGGNNL
jgi:hypothetical protein